MEPQFEIRYFGTYPMLKEFYRKIAVGPRYPTVVLTFFVILALIAYFISMGLWTDGLFYLTVAVAAVDVFVFFLPNLLVWNILRTAKRQNDGAMPETRIVVGETIEMFEGMVHYTIEYRKIVRTVRLKHSYLLMIGKRNGVMLDPNGFTKGTFEDFKQFLREKCPDLVIAQ